MASSSPIYDRRRCLQVLGVHEGSSEEDIRKAFKKLAMQYHPDKNDTPEATQKMQEINAAYAYLQENSSYDDDDDGLHDFYTTLLEMFRRMFKRESQSSERRQNFHHYYHASDSEDDHDDEEYERYPNYGFYYNRQGQSENGYCRPTHPFCSNYRSEPAESDRSRFYRENTSFSHANTQHGQFFHERGKGRGKRQRKAEKRASRLQADAEAKEKAAYQQQQQQQQSSKSRPQTPPEPPKKKKEESSTGGAAGPVNNQNPSKPVKGLSIETPLEPGKLNKKQKLKEHKRREKEMREIREELEQKEREKKEKQEQKQRDQEEKRRKLKEQEEEEERRMRREREEKERHEREMREREERRLQEEKRLKREQEEREHLERQRQKEERQKQEREQLEMERKMAQFAADFDSVTLLDENGDFKVTDPDVMNIIRRDDLNHFGHAGKKDSGKRTTSINGFRMEDLIRLQGAADSKNMSQRNGFAGQKNRSPGDLAGGSNWHGQESDPATFPQADARTHRSGQGSPKDRGRTFGRTRQQQQQPDWQYGQYQQQQMNIPPPHAGSVYSHPPPAMAPPPGFNPAYPPPAPLRPPFSRPPPPLQPLQNRPRLPRRSQPRGTVVFTNSRVDTAPVVNASSNHTTHSFHQQV